MAKILVPGVDPKVDAELRKRWNLGPNDPEPVSLSNTMFQPDQARRAEMQRGSVEPAGGIKPLQRVRALSDRAIEPPSPGWTKAKIDATLDKSADRTNFRRKDFFSVPAIDNRVELFRKSVPGAVNDVKAHIKKAEASGNFVFGAEAAAAGLSEGEALLWARGAQVYQDVRKGKWPTGSDNPGDASNLKNGYRYFKRRYSD